MPRSTTDQAIVTGASAAYWLGFASLGLSAVESVAELIVKSRRSGDPENLTLAASALVGVAGVAAIAAVPDTHDVPLPLALTQSGAWILTGGAIASALVIGSDRVIEDRIGRRGLPFKLAVAAGLGAGGSAIRVALRNRRARVHTQGRAAERRPFTAEHAPRELTRSVAMGAAAGGGLLALAAVQFAIAEGVPKLVSRVRGRSNDPVTPLVGHATSAALLSGGAAVALNRVRRYVMRADDVVEPAYPDPPTSPHVTAGPRSMVAFDAIGKEGRRFVLMALSPEEIEAVMGGPTIAPVRAVAGFGSAETPEDRAEIALAELERLGAFDRSAIVVAAPTGFGWVNCSFAEAVEYLTRGDCAIVVPQYALVPSALATNLARSGVIQQRLILEAIRDRVAGMPAAQRPRVLHFGESLGAEVALDVAADGTARFDELGVEAGLYLGTPFRSKLWSRWFADPDAVDPEGLLGQVAEAGQIAQLPDSVRHVQIVHHDDPITKFDYAMAVRAPWWMGPAATRPAGVPRETAFRPVITFLIALIDLKNGMNSKPGDFVRQGHDYRIELCQAVQAAYGLTATDDQCMRIEQALRAREREWATRRMVASRFANARDSVRAQLDRWGESTAAMDLDDLTAAALSRGEMTRMAVPDGE
ncbi:MAG TPA: alpha/beta-hydrolase family protein [Nocardioides sp.]|uniref:alpha/beta-hydrolase family protein n=1 Tax=Nocardioides sp. TaxID=35761 RepID=UPI002C39406D|nr:alpha/beta-hydrolase family protein [Nocardioides sp.]HQR25497.1 alpha/beta-hydrolase family protein [Nocardioides sp.]